MRQSVMNKLISAVLVLALCFGMVPAVASPAVAAELSLSAVGDNEWIVRNDDFGTYTMGKDTFWNNSKYSGFSSSYHGSIGSGNYAAYGIVEENGNKMLELINENKDKNGTYCNYFNTEKVTGAYSMSFDFYMPRSSGSSVPGLVLGLLGGMTPALPGNILVYIDGGSQIRLVEGITNASTSDNLTTVMKNADGNDMTATLDTWFSIKLSIEPGKFMVKVWPRGEQEPADDATAGVCVFEHASLTEEVLSRSKAGRIQTRSRKGCDAAYIVRIDNLKLAKSYENLLLPARLFGDPGDEVTLEPVFTGQDLFAQQPVPQLKYTLSDPNLGSVSSNGELVLRAAGQGTISVELLDIDGNSNGVAHRIALTVGGGEALRVLSIGNSYSRDALAYLSPLALLMGERVECAYLDLDEATLRMHARNVAKEAAEYQYYTSNPVTGELDEAATASSINEVLADQVWDVIVLQQNVEEAGIDTTYTADLQFLLDYLADVQPQAEVYWNMTWANQVDTEERTEDFARLYDSNQNVMYNAIVDCLGQFIVGEGAEYAADFDGWFPVGAAIQNVRATAIGDTLTRDGYHLSLQAGRLTAAMTVLKVLFPEADLSGITPATAFFLEGDTDYTNSEANMALIRQSVEAACADLSEAPAKLTAPAPKRVEDVTSDPNDVTVGQVEAPLSLHFGDLVVDKAGTVYVTGYECTVHVPTRNTGDYKQDGKEGPGRLKIWKSTDNGKTWDYANPLLTIDQRKLEEWDIVPGLYDRYASVKAGATDYTYFMDVRDPNFGIMYYDMDGNGTEDEVLLYTFWGFQFKESGSSNSEGTYIMYSMDGGENWSVPQRITTKHCGNGGIKRGDIANFSEGQILVPLYGTPIVVALLLQWDVATQKWVTLSDTKISNYVPEKGSEMNECSFVAPDPEGDVVHGFVRSNGQVVTSYDRGRTWEHAYTIVGNVQQPGWAYIDESRAFATWSFDAVGGRDTKGQMVYFDAGWEATQPAIIHENYYRGEHDSGDPSSKLLANGKILTIMYDSYFRAINGRFVDPDAPEFRLPELNDQAANVTLKTLTPDSADVVVSGLPFSHTLKSTATFTANGKLTITAANGAKVEFTAGRYGIVADKATELRLAVTNGATYIKAWPVDGTQPEEWTLISGGTDTNSGTATFAGTGVTLGTVTVTRNAVLFADAGGEVVAGMSAAVATVNPADMTDKVTWTVSNPAIASIDKQGVITFLGAGTVTAKANIGGKMVSVTYNVMGASAEVTRLGEKKVVFADDFEDFTVGENTFFDELTSNGYELSGHDPELGTEYDIVEENGNKYLKLSTKNSNSAGFRVDTPIEGDYTVQFDFFAPDGNMDRWTYINMWETSGIYAMVQMNGDHLRVQHQDADTGENVNSATFYGNDAGIWNTMKIARVDGGVYVKVWPQGTPEPLGWQYSVHEEELKTDNTAKFRLSIWTKLAEEHVMLLDNLLITQQKPTTRGTFNLEVVNTIMVNGETVDICRWVWTPLREM